MNFDTASRNPGIRLVAGVAVAVILLSAGALLAQTATTINGTDVSNDVLNMYLESRLQKPAAQATPEERDRALTELTDIYLLTTQPRADVLAKNPRTKAQIELQTRGILAQAVAADFVESNQASDEEIKSEYDEQLAASPPVEFKARHILVETQSEAIGLIEELDGGADFVELAKEKSTGPSGPNGGDLGWFAPNQMVAPFSEAVAALEDGGISKSPVQTQFGWHVILREESREATPPTLESVRDVVKQRIEQERLQDYLKSLRAELAE